MLKFESFAQKKNLIIEATFSDKFKHRVGNVFLQIKRYLDNFHKRSLNKSKSLQKKPSAEFGVES